MTTTCQLYVADGRESDVAVTVTGGNRVLDFGEAMGLVSPHLVHNKQVFKLRHGHNE